MSSREGATVSSGPLWMTAADPRMSGNDRVVVVSACGAHRRGPVEILRSGEAAPRSDPGEGEHREGAPYQHPGRTVPHGRPRRPGGAARVKCSAASRGEASSCRVSHRELSPCLPQRQAPRGLDWRVGSPPPRLAPGPSPERPSPPALLLLRPLGAALESGLGSRRRRARRHLGRAVPPARRGVSRLGGSLAQALVLLPRRAVPSALARHARRLHQARPRGGGAPPAPRRRHARQAQGRSPPLPGRAREPRAPPARPGRAPALRLHPRQLVPRQRAQRRHVLRRRRRIPLLFETGCYADFTFPAAPNESQPNIVNQIYWPVGTSRSSAPTSRASAPASAR